MIAAAVPFPRYSGVNDLLDQIEPEKLVPYDLKQVHQMTPQQAT
jgi:hypothetical protein